jgi:hypothetical protein
MPAYASADHEPARLTGEWQATGRTRLRSTWFGLLVVEVEQSAMVLQTAAPGIGRTVGTWQEVRRWRRAWRGHIVTLGSDVLRAFMRGKAERNSG